MLAAIRSSWPLFLGVALMMLGNGLQTSLLGVRAGLESFATSATGVIMSMYFVGFLAGSLLVPRMIGTVGHVRVFAALASIASTATLIHTIFVEPATWAVMRSVTGFAFAGLFIVAESWLNDRATNQTRGSLLAVYMVVLMGGTAGGQLLLNLDDPTRFQLFALVSVLISLSLVPLLLSATPAPAIRMPEKVGLLQLYRASPLGVVGCFGTGVAHGAALGMGAVYAGAAGFSVAEISAFMGAVYLGGMLAQGPIGVLSDRFDRRLVLTVTTLAASGAAIAAGWGGRRVERGDDRTGRGVRRPDAAALCPVHQPHQRLPDPDPDAGGERQAVPGHRRRLDPGPAVGRGADGPAGPGRLFRLPGGGAPGDRRVRAVADDPPRGPAAGTAGPLRHPVGDRHAGRRRDGGEGRGRPTAGRRARRDRPAGRLAGRGRSGERARPGRAGGQRRRGRPGGPAGLTRRPDARARPFRAWRGPVLDRTGGPA
ncbi:hypothetical protein CKO28_21765 [Rhodovibrio sodomensis]|uniref:Major facilitator superfamily (MFS) profile domain-containing protein n=1 Tax=Rhodovibrio sodomensis TaxID=1088 RepID=A0ABS1DKL7_9PROT|nr:hypothetical protein [Rhodovibrio sodomensis]